MKVKGKNRPLGCYEVFAERGQTSSREDQLLALFAAGLEAYRAGDFALALGVFERSEELEAVAKPGHLNPSRLYQQRCRHLLANPPETWDGVWTLTAK